MVGGGDTIDAELQWANRLLAEYDERDYLKRVLQNEDIGMTLIDRCLNGFSAWEKDLLYALCVKKVSEREYAKKVGLTRYRVREEKKRLLKMAALVLKKCAFLAYQTEL